MSDSQQSGDSFHEISKHVQFISLMKMKSMCGSEAFTVQEEVPQRVVLDHWLSEIMVAGSGFRIFFKIYFSTATIRSWSASVYQGSPGGASVQQIHDFAKEFCNLVSGELKNSLATKSLDVGTSLPLITRGFDRLFKTELESETSKECIWALQQNNQSVICSIEFQNKNNITVGAFQNTILETHDVEFF